MENTEKKSQWGGARKNSGRKKVKGRNFNFRALPEVETILDSTDGSKSDYINTAILYYHSHNM